MAVLKLVAAGRSLRDYGRQPGAVVVATRAAKELAAAGYIRFSRSRQCYVIEPKGEAAIRAHGS